MWSSVVSESARSSIHACFACLSRLLPVLKHRMPARNRSCLRVQLSLFRRWPFVHTTVLAVLHQHRCTCSLHSITVPCIDPVARVIGSRRAMSPLNRVGLVAREARWGRPSQPTRSTSPCTSPGTPKNPLSQDGHRRHCQETRLLSRSSKINVCHLSADLGPMIDSEDTSRTLAAPPTGVSERANAKVVGTASTERRPTSDSEQRERRASSISVSCG